MNANAAVMEPPARAAVHPRDIAAPPQTKPAVCPDCRGVGFELPLRAEEGWVCPTCHGSGVM